VCFIKVLRELDIGFSSYCHSGSRFGVCLWQRMAVGNFNSMDILALFHVFDVISPLKFRIHAWWDKKFAISLSWCKPLFARFRDWLQISIYSIFFIDYPFLLVVITILSDIFSFVKHEAFSQRLIHGLRKNRTEEAHAEDKEWRSMRTNCQPGGKWKCPSRVRGAAIMHETIENCSRNTQGWTFMQHRLKWIFDQNWFNFMICIAKCTSAVQLWWRKIAISCA
jgi:hypothetical protein